LTRLSPVFFDKPLRRVVAFCFIKPPQIFQFAKRSSGGRKTRNIDDVAKNSLVLDIAEMIEVKLHYLRMSKFRAFVGEFSRKRHRRVDGRCAKMRGDGFGDGLDLLTTDTFAIELFPDLENKLVFRTRIPHPSFGRLSAVSTRWKNDLSD